MINITQYTHFPNTTELGKGNTHECYLLIKRDHDLSNLFPPGEEIAVTEVSTQKKYYFKSAQGNEFRINQLGVLYRDFDVHYGDVLTITNLGGDKGKTYVSVTKYNRVVLYVTSKGVEVLNEERLKTFEQKGSARNYRLNVLVDGEQNALDIRFAEALPKRSDSPSTTDYFKAELNGANLSNGTYALTLGQVNELNILEKSSLKVFPFDENMLSPIDEKAHDNSKSSELLLFQSDDATQFVWECIKLFNDNKELKELFSSDYKTAGGSSNNYIRINGCYVAQQGKIDIEGYESIYTDEEGYINNGFDAREVDKFAIAVNDVYAGRYNIVIEDNLYKLIKLQNGKQIVPQCKEPALISQDYQYMAAIKTKPFLILGGFSGTGKSIAVKSLAFATCPCDGYLNASETTPGNYLLLSVKPNWHDATEITGFRSSVNHNYYVTDFMKFVIKAKMYEDQNVPFFVCLDEMNLAPVEEYFADFLSVIESRTKRQDGRIVTDALISKSVFNDSNYADDFNIFLELGIHPTIEVNDLTEFNAQLKASEEDAFYQEQWLVDELKEHGMTIPQNLIVIGTVNMDDTTNSFSRKVIDRAMTFETVVGEFDVDDYFADGSGILMEYCQKPSKGELYISDEVRATDLDSNYLNDKEKKQIIDFINNINKDLDGTPFQISYRILNETILLYRSKKEIDHIIGSGFELGVEFSLDLNDIFDDILMQKILPRIEGDYDKCHTAIENLSRRAKDSEWKRSIDKLAFMGRRFGPDKSGFTSFWN